MMISLQLLVPVEERVSYKQVSLFVISLLLLVFSTSTVHGQQEDNGSLQQPDQLDVSSLVASLRGEDYRLFRWDASDETIEKQPEICEKKIFDNVITLLQHTANTVSQTEEEDDNEKLQYLYSCLEYITFCITDNPSNREIFASSYKDIHETIVLLLNEFIPSLQRSPNEYTKGNIAAGAAHVVYITSFANTINHQKFIQLNTIQSLSKLIQVTADVSQRHDEIEQHIVTSYPWVTMWASIAISNLIANYCESTDRCYYHWDHSTNQLVVDDESLPITSNGSIARQQVLNDSKLISVLQMLSCAGPIPEHFDEEDEDQIPISVTNSLIDRDEHNNELYSWAAVSVMKNLAIDGSPLAHKAIEHSIACFCHHSVSNDWLEEDKGMGVLHYIRSNNPCWFTSHYNNEQQFIGNTLCVDNVFLSYDTSSNEYITCSDIYGEDYDEENNRDRGIVSQEQCLQLKDKTNNSISAVTECCVCGGGTIINPPQNEDYDEIESEL